MNRDLISKAFQEHQETVSLVARTLEDVIDAFAGEICRSLLSGGKILIMGNGGSASDAQHFAAEFVGRFLMERRALPAIALSTDTSILTAVGNDYGFDDVFRRQVEALALPGDLVVGISTSGNSANVLNALKEAKKKGCVTAGLLGRDGGAIKEVADLALVVPVDQTPRIQESHSLIIHILCDLVEKSLFGKSGCA